MYSVHCFKNWKKLFKYGKIWDGSGEKPHEGNCLPKYAKMRENIVNLFLYMALHTISYKSTPAFYQCSARMAKCNFKSSNYSLTEETVIEDTLLFSLSTTLLSLLVLSAMLTTAAPPPLVSWLLRARRPLELLLWLQLLSDVMDMLKLLSPLRKVP